MRSSRRGVTLIEVLVASTVAFMLVIVLWRIFSGSMKQFHHTQTNLEAMQVGQMALEYIENDLHGLLLTTQADGSLLSTAKDHSLDFYVARNAGNTGVQGPIYRGERITYGLVDAPGRPYSFMSRNGKKMAGMQLKDLNFEIVKMQSLSSTDHYYLKTTVTATDLVGKKSFTLMGIVALEIITQTQLGQRWKPNPYRYKRF